MGACNPLTIFLDTLTFNLIPKALANLQLNSSKPYILSISIIKENLTRLFNLHTCLSLSATGSAKEFEYQQITFTEVFYFYK